MDIRGLLLINSESELDADPSRFGSGPMALWDVAGKSALERTAERLSQFGSGPVTAVIADSWSGQFRPSPTSEANLTSIYTPQDRFWRTAENAFGDLVQLGAELVILIKLGPYQEVDFEKFVQYHIDRNCRVSQLFHQDRTLETFCISASRRNDAASLFRSRLSKCRIECPLLEHVGYLNPLAEASDLRQFAIDILTLRTETRPAGRETKPGVWVAPGAQIEKGARVLAPGFVGSRARIRAGAVVTRCTTIERNAEIDCGTVVENSSVLTDSYVGAGLDLAHSVTGMGMVTNLRRGATAVIADVKLVRNLSTNPAHKFLSSATELMTFLPRQMWRGVFGARDRAADLNEALRQTSPTLGTAAGFQAPACDTQAADEFPTNFVVARTHGNQ